MGTENYAQLLFPELYIHPKRGRNIVKKFTVLWNIRKHWFGNLPGIPLESHHNLLLHTFNNQSPTMTMTIITYHYPTTPPPSIYIGWVLKAHYVYVCTMQEKSGMVIPILATDGKEMRRRRAAASSCCDSLMLCATTQNPLHSYTTTLSIIN